MKNSYVSGLHDGARIDDVFIIHSKSLAHTQEGAPYVRLKLGDKTGTIDAIKWDASESLYGGISNDDFMQVRGIVSRYRDKLQITVDSIRRCTDKVDPRDFLPQCSADIDEMVADLLEMVSTVKQPHLRALLDHFFCDQEFLARFSTAPAAQKIHHAYIGGLIEHSLSAARMCSFVADHYDGVHRDLLVTGAILHDAGKVDEFCWDKSIRYSLNGHMIGHIVSGAMMIEKAMAGIDGFPPLLNQMMLHIILSHHGQKEYGSPKRPKSIEGMILHFVEDMDAKVNTFQQAVGNVDSLDEDDLLTEKNWVFDRPLIKGIPKSITGETEDEVDILKVLEAEYDPFSYE